MSRMRSMWMKCGVTLAVLAAYAACTAGTQRKWEPEVKSNDVEFWQMSKTGSDMMAATRKGLDEASSDLARNVKAVQGAGRLMSGCKEVVITYDATTSGGIPMNVSLVVTDNGVVVPATTFSEDSDIGLRITPGRNKRIVWDAGKDYDNKQSSDMVAKVTAVLADNPSTWAVVTISWASFGGRDLDVCGYWVDRQDVKVGWSYGTGSTSSTYRSTWRGDNTGSGPEYINIGVVPGETLEGVRNRAYRVHCNYFGSVGSAAKATVVVSCGGMTLAKTISTGTHTRTAANMSDPCVTIYFDEAGKLNSIQ